MRGFSFLGFVALTAICWGLYGVVLHNGQALMGETVDGVVQLSRWKPFMYVGMAYFVIAVIYPLFVLTTGDEKGRWSLGGIVWSFLAGAVGAIGALGIILAFTWGGKPVFVMPLVFGLAPVVNTVLTMIMARRLNQASLTFYIGVLVVAIGAAGVLYFKPAKPKETADATISCKPDAQASEFLGSVFDGFNTTIQPSPTALASSQVVCLARLPIATATSAPAKNPNRLAVILAIGFTALCWGTYGPILHAGQAKMDGSKLRPFLCVGVAYFIIAVLVPIPWLSSDPGSWVNISGGFWSLLAGAAGAIGALGIIYAFNFGGKPIFVMPLVFGLAPVINTFFSTISAGTFNQITWPFLLSLALVIFGAVTVLLTAPRPPAPTKTDDLQPDQAKPSSKSNPSARDAGEPSKAKAPLETASENLSPSQPENSDE